MDLTLCSVRSFEGRDEGAERMGISRHVSKAPGIPQLRYTIHLFYDYAICPK